MLYICATNAKGIQLYTGEDGWKPPTSFVPIINTDREPEVISEDFVIDFTDKKLRYVRYLSDFYQWIYDQFYPDFEITVAHSSSLLKDVEVIWDEHRGVMIRGGTISSNIFEKNEHIKKDTQVSIEKKILLEMYPKRFPENKRLLTRTIHAYSPIATPENAYVFTPYESPEVWYASKGRVSPEAIAQMVLLGEPGYVYEEPLEIEPVISTLPTTLTIPLEEMTTQYYVKNEPLWERRITTYEPISNDMIFSEANGNYIREQTGVLISFGYKFFKLYDSTNTQGFSKQIENSYLTKIEYHFSN